MKNLTHKKEYAAKMLEETLFSESHQMDIIRLIILSIEAFNDDYFEVKDTLVWNTRVDMNLAQHLLIMFEKTMKIPLNQIGMGEFNVTWNQYIETDEYYLQALNYIVNSDDYVFGDRFKLLRDSEKEIRKSNYLSNAMQRWETFKENPHKKSVYYGRIMAMARDLNDLVNSKYK